MWKYHFSATLVTIFSCICMVASKRINATCSWSEPNSGRIDPFSCYIRTQFKIIPNDTLEFNSEIDASEIAGLTFWLPINSRYQWEVSFVPSEIFHTFPHLKYFTLPGRVESISRDDFTAAIHLQRLTIGNQLKVIPANVFDPLTNLEVLDLSWNKIKTIQENAFKGLIHLQTLKLNRNHLHRLDVHTFEGLPLLEELLLSNNQIETIDEDTFKLPSLKRLDLSYNKLKELSDAIFMECSNLEYLDLRSNQITLIRRSVYGLNGLQYLNFDNNHISDVFLKGLVRLKSLEHLSIENNGKTLNDNIFASETFSGSTKSSIVRLFLSGNDLKNREILVRLWALGLTHLERLHLDNNAFEYIDFYPIDAFPKLEEINLGKNLWKCDWLQQTLDRLESDGIEVNLFSSRFPSSTSDSHVNFIPCS